MKTADHSAQRSGALPDHAVRFGTSGLRGRAEAFTPAICHAYVSAFVGVARNKDCDQRVFIGADRRESSPQIASRVMNAVADSGLDPVYMGILPTPALAAYAFERNCLSIMVTGSHIPADYNGLKFYRHDGELTKEDEPEILSRVQVSASQVKASNTWKHREGSSEAANAYVAHCLAAFATDMLRGFKLGVDLHSGAGTELVAQVLEALGAEVLRFGHADAFVAVDTEALDPERLSYHRAVVRDHSLDGIVSTDGDGDRPLLIDENGEQVAGDVLGILTARFLGIERVVTPVTSTSAIEATGWFRSVVRTKVGSPYVIAAMAKQQGRVAGFEGNGGFILGSDVERNGRYLTKLPTRDALLPLISSLAAAASQGQSVSAMVAQLPKRCKLSDRLTEIAPEQALSLLSGLANSSAIRQSFAERLVDPAEIDLSDGVRLVCQDGSIVQFRQSGNAPEFRCYVETSQRQEAQALLHTLMQSLAAHFGTCVQSGRIC